MKPVQTPSLNEPDFNYSGIYTYADYLRWTIEERIELIRGKIFRMSPAPLRSHQEILTNLSLPFLNFFARNPCQVFLAPFDVRFPRKGKKDEDIITVLQPDLCVICDPEKVDERGGIGAPELVVEVLSKGNTRKEMKLKYEIYEESGVKEYWVIAPEHRVCFIYVLEGNRYRALPPVPEDQLLQSVRFPGLEVAVNDVFKSKF